MVIKIEKNMQIDFFVKVREEEEIKSVAFANGNFWEIYLFQLSINIRKQDIEFNLHMAEPYKVLY